MLLICYEVLKPLLNFQLLKNLFRTFRAFQVSINQVFKEIKSFCELSEIKSF